jgi:hypothetical protein
MLQNLIVLLYLLLGAATYPLFAYLVIARRFAAIERAIPGLSRWDLAWRFLSGKPLLDLDGVEPIPPTSDPPETEFIRHTNISE